MIVAIVLLAILVIVFFALWISACLRNKDLKSRLNRVIENTTKTPIRCVRIWLRDVKFGVDYHDVNDVEMNNDGQLSMMHHGVRVKITNVNGYREWAKIDGDDDD